MHVEFCRLGETCIRSENQPLPSLPAATSARGTTATPCADAPPCRRPQMARVPLGSTRNGKAPAAQAAASSADEDSDDDDLTWRFVAEHAHPPPTQGAEASDEGAGPSGHGPSSWAFVSSNDPRCERVLDKLSEADEAERNAEAVRRARVEKKAETKARAKARRRQQDEATGAFAEYSGGPLPPSPPPSPPSDQPPLTAADEEMVQQLLVDPEVSQSHAPGPPSAPPSPPRSPPPSPPPEPTEEDVGQRQLLELLSDPATRARVQKAVGDQARAEGDEGEAAAEVLTALLSQHLTLGMLRFAIDPPDPDPAVCRSRGWPMIAFERCRRDQCALSCMRRWARGQPEVLDDWASRRVRLEELYKEQVAAAPRARMCE